MRTHKRGYSSARISIAAVVLATGFGSLAFLGCAMPALADDIAPAHQTSPANGGPTLDVELSDVPLTAAISMIQKQMKNINFIFQNDRAKYRTVTLTAHGQPIGEVLKLIAKSAGADIWMEDGIYHVAPEGTHVPDKPLKIGQIRLNFANAEAVKEALTGEGGSKIDLNLLPKFIDTSILGDIGRQMAPGPLSHGSSAYRLLPRRDADEPGGFGRIEDQRGGGLFFEHPIEPRDITALSQNSTIIIRYRDDAEGEAQFIEMVQRVRMLDVKPRKIQIRARFISISQGDADRMGINWHFQRVNLRGDVYWGFPASDQVVMQFVSGNVVSQLNSVLTTGIGKEVAALEVTTLNNAPAEFTSATTVYSFIPETSPIIDGLSKTTYYANPIQDTSRLIVTPKVNSDGTITLSTHVQLQHKDTDHTDGKAPVEQITPVYRTLRAGESMVLGRLIRKQDGSPFEYAMLPGAPPLNDKKFKTNEKTGKDKELLIFITATIVDDPKPDASKADGRKHE